MLSLFFSYLVDFRSIKASFEINFFKLLAKFSTFITILPLKHVGCIICSVLVLVTESMHNL